MTPMYNPEDWEKEFDLTLKYDPVNSSTVNKIVSQYKRDEILDYIKQLWSLIDYQRKIISQQTQQIVAFKHKEAWKRYDKPIEEYDPSTRKYVDKPDKSGNMSC